MYGDTDHGVGNSPAEEPDPALCYDMGRFCVYSNLRRTWRTISTLYDEILQPSGLTAGQVTILAATTAVTEREGEVSLTGLAQVLGMDLSTLSRNLAVLQRQGLVQLATGRDRRQRMIALTREGKSRLARAMPLWHALQNTVYAEMGEEDVLQTLCLLRRLGGAANRVTAGGQNGGGG